MLISKDAAAAERIREGCPGDDKRKLLEEATEALHRWSHGWCATLQMSPEAAEECLLRWQEVEVRVQELEASKDQITANRDSLLARVEEGEDRIRELEREIAGTR